MSSHRRQSSLQCKPVQFAAISRCGRVYLDLDEKNSQKMYPFVTCAVNTGRNQPEAKSKTSDVPTSSTTDKIVIPKRKKRNATSILEALSSTVGKDYTAPAYRYMDDPFMIPTDNFNKKSFALSKAAGRKAAKKLLEQYKTYVVNMYDFAEPKIEAYTVKEEEYTHTEPGELALLERIHKRRVLDAVQVYKAAHTNGVALSEPTLEALLQLVCVYNGEDPPPPLELEETWYRRDFEEGKKMWSKGSVAEDIFASLKEKSPAAYSSLVRAYAKYGNMETAWEMYCKMKDKKIPVSLTTCNALLRGCVLPKDSFDSKWGKVLTVLKDIQMSGLSPNLATFNAVLFSLSRMTRYTKSRMLSLQTLAEMKSCGVEPSLGSWMHVLRIFYDTDASDARILLDIVEYLEDKHLAIQDPADFDFFSTAMIKCNNNLQDVELAYRIDALLKTGDNIKFITDSAKEGMYNSNFFHLICLLEDMDTIMNHYDQITPNIWTPTYSGLEDLFRAIELHDGYQHIPLIWSDMVLFHYFRNAGLLKCLLELMAKKQQEPEVQSRLAEVARSVKDRWLKDQASNSLRPMELTGAMISDLIIVAVRGEDFDLAWELVGITEEEDRKIAGLLSGPALITLLEACIAQRETEKALQCVNKLGDQGLTEVQEAIEKAKAGLQLTDLQRSELETLSR